MMKRLGVAFLCIGFGSLLHAEGMSISKSILGLEVGYATVQADTDGGIFGEPNYKGKDIEYGLRIGVQDDDWRAMFVYDYYDNTEELYNIKSDPLELNNLIDKEINEGNKLKEQLFNWTSAPKKYPVTEQSYYFTQKEIEELEALGYIN